MIYHIRVTISSSSVHCKHGFNSQLAWATGVTIAKDQYLKSTVRPQRKLEAGRIKDIT